MHAPQQPAWTWNLSFSSEGTTSPELQQLAKAPRLPYPPHCYDPGCHLALHHLEFPRQDHVLDFGPHIPSHTSTSTLSISATP
ncbi:uncharacterized protein QC763_0031960 [Podospora pseudopauciseta]|uniref:Uncharacterized protein n=2 Tax=Podospora TaxID=5144 RepID=A0ABR0HNA7_9PEZI|nr:hypothetical protein QC763_0031960 [Podospora pseudopauciseta]KAK4679253.1 hypothetical protein QC764_0032850 [Podospora pseudoanserina]